METLLQLLPTLYDTAVKLPNETFLEIFKSYSPTVSSEALYKATARDATLKETVDKVLKYRGADDRRAREGATSGYRSNYYWRAVLDCVPKSQYSLYDASVTGVLNACIGRGECK